MGGCFSKNTTSTSNVTPAHPQFDLKSDPQNVLKKEVFVIKHRISHEIDRHSDQGNDGNPVSSRSKEEVDAILIKCGRLSRSKSTGAQNPKRRRRYSRSKRSFDFDLNSRLKNADEDDDDDDDDDALDHHHHHHRQKEIRISRRNSYSREQRSSSKERRISISPGRRSESPSPSLRNLSTTATSAGSGSSNRPPAKMVSVPATHKTKNVGAVKRIHVKRNVSPASSSSRTNIWVFTETQSQEQTQQEARAADDTLLEIDNNATSSNTKITRKLSRDLDTVVFDPPTPPTYASLLLEDIHNFHINNNTKLLATSSPAFALPECVSKACSIMEAVAHLNSNTRWTNPTTINNTLSAAIQVQECRKPNSADPTTPQECQVTQSGGFQRDYPNNRSTAYSIPNCTTVVLA